MPGSPGLHITTLLQHFHFNRLAESLIFGGIIRNLGLDVHRTNSLGDTSAICPAS